MTIEAITPVVSPAQEVASVVATERTGIWAESISYEQAQTHTRHLLFYRDLLPIVDHLAYAHMAKSGGGPSPLQTDEEVKAGIIDTLYSGTIKELPHGLRQQTTKPSDLLEHGERNVAAYSNLIRDYSRHISRAWDTRMGGQDVSKGRRIGIVTGTTFDMLSPVSVVGHKKMPTDVYRALGYTPTEISRIQRVRTRTLPANILLLAANDYGTTAAGVVTSQLVDIDKVPVIGPAKPLLLSAAVIGYYAQFGITLDKVRKLMEHDPEISPSYPAYTAFPLIQRMFAEEEVGAKRAAVAATYVGLNPYELWKEGYWNAYTMTSENGGDARLVGDAAAAIVLAIQAFGLMPLLKKTKPTPQR